MGLLILWKSVVCKCHMLSPEVGVLNVRRGGIVFGTSLFHFYHENLVIVPLNFINPQ